MNKAAALFQGWPETMVWSCLQGCMGQVLVEGGEEPASAAALIGDFAFFAGRPDRALAQKADASILVPGDQGWACLLEEVWGAKIIPWTRYATEKDPSSFCRAKLEGYAGPPTGFELRPMDGALYTQAMKEDWSRDLCALFEDGLDYEARGIGVAVLCGGELVAGASSYAVYRDGIEIEIDTRPDQRGKGLATACGARLILDCLDRGLYPSWDAHDKRSAHLAQKLGYRLAGAYRAYLNMERPAPGLPVP